MRTIGHLFLPVAMGVGRVVPLLHGWHLDDLVRDSPRMAAIAIGLYSSEWCLDAWHLFGFDGSNLPSRTHLFLGEYDIERRKEVWWRADDDTMWLDVRFNMSRAPAVAFSPAGGGRSFEIWEGGTQTWREWLDERLRFDVSVTNTFPFAVQHGSIEIPAGETRTVERVLPGDVLAFRSGGGVEYAATAVNSGSGCATLRIPEKEERLEISDKRLNARDQDTTFTHSAILRQPPLVPDVAGVSSYEIMDLPKALEDRLWAFYRNHDRTLEAYSKTNTGINQHLVETTMVSFDDDTRERDAIARMIQPLVEAWAGQPLVFTSFYGIREYYRGAELRMHVDRVATHVFSVIINLHQESMDADWPLEVIDFDGSRASVLLRPGQLLFYQSAKLIHGRPSPLNGSLYANAFCHFKPTQGWDYVYGAADVLYYQGRPVLDYKVD